ncbi:MAG: HAD family hydrolase [Planctomycetes bacterium]|nr:HAD family hydrolase [Planctomycetota bacterium]
MDRAVFLDRDNTLIADPGYLSEPSAVELLSGAPEALRLLAEAGFKLVLVTNQSGIARGLLDETQLAAIHAELSRQLAEGGARLDAVYYCPYHPDGTVERFARESDERKPSPGMLLRAGREMKLDLAASWMIGDRPRDILAGRSAGCRTVRVLTGGQEAGEEEVEADFTCPTLLDAARLIVARAERTAPPAPAAPAATRSVSDSELLAELVQLTRQQARRDSQEEFSVTRLLAGVFQGVALLSLAVAMFRFLPIDSPGREPDAFYGAMGWFSMAAVLQLAALGFLLAGRR